MALPPVSPLFRQYVDDEMLRAPLVFDQLLDAVLDEVRRGLSGMVSTQRTAVADLMQALQTQRVRMGDYFMHSLREQVQVDMNRQPAKGSKAPEKTPEKPRSLSLVDEDEVAIDVEYREEVSE